MSAFEIAVLTTGFLLILAGCFCLMRTYHIIKIIIGIEIAMKAVTLFIAYAGHINGEMGLAQSFIITIIVVEVVIAVVLSGISLNLYKKYKSMDLRNIRKLKG